MANSIPAVQVFTCLGAMVRGFDGQLWPALATEHGHGLMLMYDMPQPGDGRHAEVYLDYAAVVALRDGIDQWIEEQNR